MDDSPIRPVYSCTPEELKELIRNAAEAGAKQALADIGLHDEHAGADVKELRELLRSWKDTKREMWKTVVRWGTTIILGLISFAVWVKTGGSVK